MELIKRYRLRWQRRRLLFRAFRKRRSLRVKADRTGLIRKGQILCLVTLRNERTRLPYFLDYYRKLGVEHFLFVDNASQDGSREYLCDQPDCSVWHTSGSYKRARFGMDWINWLLTRYARGHWVLVVDPDEFLVYPYLETRPIQALTDWLDRMKLKSFGALLLDMYPQGPIGAQPYREGQDPFEILTHFDSGNYVANRHPKYHQLWIQGGPRQRVVFSDDPESAPALNKIPLVKWRFGTVYASSTHHLLPRGYNKVYAEGGGERASGCLLHAKFLDTFSQKVSEELERKEHFAGSREYRAYAEKLAHDTGMDTPNSIRFEDWRQLDRLGLMSFGGWA